MKAISLREPYAHLWCMGLKMHETRGYRTRHRGWLLVHASSWADFAKLPAALVEKLDKRIGGWQERWTGDGRLIGAVYVTRCEPSGMARQLASPDELLYGDFSPGRWAWRAERHLIFSDAIPFKGRLGVFDVDEQLVVERSPFAAATMSLRPRTA